MKEDHAAIREYLRDWQIQHYSYTATEGRKCILLLKKVTSPTNRRTSSDICNNGDMTLSRPEPFSFGNNMDTLYNAFVIEFQKGTELTAMPKKRILGEAVRWEKLQTKEITQCRNCQSLGHVATNRNMKHRCVTCREEHQPGQNKRTNPEEGRQYCVLCKEEGHQANYRGWPKHREVVAAKGEQQRKAKKEVAAKQRNQPLFRALTVNTERIIPLYYGDRFIPRRYAAKKKEFNENLMFQGGKDDFFNTRLSQSNWRYKGLKLAMNSSFGIKQRRILEFSDLATKSTILSIGDVLPTTPCYEFIYGSLNGFDWPCVPRLKPSACADTTHDLPYFDMFSDLNLIDWSVKGQIAASFGQDLVLWQPSLDLTLVYRIRNSKSIAYCPKAKFLAISSHTTFWAVFELWDVEHFKELCVCNGHVFSNINCTVICIEWAHSGKTVVCGTEVGWVYVFSVPDLETIRILKNHKQSVFMMKFSPTMRYLATSDIQGNIYVYSWPSCEIHVVLRSKRELRVVIDWHPWNGTDLAISEDSPASVVILHVPSREIVAYFQRRDKKVQIDFITFNKLTGELLVSYSDKDADGCVRSEILVMSSLDRVVDVLRIPDSCVRFMMWSPNGMQLATAGNDETLTIWNFLPNRYKDRLGRSADNVQKYQNGTKQSKLTLDLHYGSEFSKWLSMK